MVLDKNKFLFLLVNNNSLSPEETNELQLLQDDFPYSQAIHNLVARGSQLNNLAVKQTKLNKAAVYATDRAILKTLITAPAGQRKEETKAQTDHKAPPPATTEQISEKTDTPAEQQKEEIKPDKKAKEQIKQAPSTKVTAIPESGNATEFTPSSLSGDELLDELFEDLDKLKKLKEGFEVATANFDAGVPTPATTVTPGDRPVKEEKVNKEQKASKKVKSGNKGIIAEIKSSKKKIKPSDPRQKEQLDIIDKFIKNKPSIPKGKTSSHGPPATDLAESSSVFSDKIVSETLVEILIKQGKKEKAIEVLRKLIWKFPQKKAYFAAQIEELTS